MTAIIAFVAESGLGTGVAALGLADARTAVRRDEALAGAGLLRPFCARADLPGKPDDRAALLLQRALDGISRELDRVRPAWREERVGLALGTSSGGMETFSGAGGLYGTYLGPVLAAARARSFEPFSLVLGACISGTVAIGLARSWLDQDLCDVAIAGGFDGVSVFVAAGFEALRATCTESPKPFRVNRDGLALGEGAALVALARGEGEAFISGFGASCDAVHLTAPDRTGDGLARAGKGALEDAGSPPIALVSAHATSTEYNDAAEAKAIVRLAPAAAVHALKGAIGHTLGAAGAIETVAAMEALRARIAPASAGQGPIMEGIHVHDTRGPLEGRNALKLASAFGGANAALVVSLDEPRARPRPRAVYLSRAVHVAEAPSSAALAAQTGYAEDRIARGDPLVVLALAAAARLPFRGEAGIVLGHGFATHETNSVYLARIRKAGAHRAEPRRFPYTSPNAAAGECAVALGLRGPSFAVGGGPHGGIEALMVARDLVATGAADQMLVVAVDEAGPAALAMAPGTRAGAVALVVGAEPAAARLEACAVRLDPNDKSSLVPTSMDAHRALLSLADPEARPESLKATLPSGGFASARLVWL